MSACRAYIVVEDEAEMAYCELDADHDGPHRVVIEWDDAAQERSLPPVGLSTGDAPHASPSGDYSTGGNDG